MRLVAWEPLIGLIGIATSTFFGLNGVSRTLNSRIIDLGLKIDGLGLKIDDVRSKVTSREDLLAVIYAFSKSAKEGRAVSLDDLGEGYVLARGFFKGP